MRPFHILVLAAFLPLASAAQEAGPPPLSIMAAADVVLADFLWLKRPVVVFADSPNDPNFTHQMALLAADPAALDLRDVVVITDTDPAARTAIRQHLRPRGFSLVLIDKDGEVKLRKPLPWNVREITHTFDRFPLARQERLERHPAGR